MQKLSEYKLKKNIQITNGMNAEESKPNKWDGSAE